MAWPALSARSKNWGTEVLTDADLESELDLLHDYVNDALNASTGHKHDGTTAEGPKILTANVDDSAGAQGDVFYSSGTALTRLAAGTDGQFLKTQGAAANPTWDTVNGDQSQDGSTIQIVNTTDGAVATGTTAFPNDDTIPQNTEGDEYMTLAVTPGATTNILKIEVVFTAATTGATINGLGLFQDSTAGALAAIQFYNAADTPTTVTMIHYMTAGTTSATTFKVRAGATSGTMTFNGASSARKLGGVYSSSITITELKGS